MKGELLNLICSLWVKMNIEYCLLNNFTFLRLRVNDSMTNDLMTAKRNDQ